MFWQSLNLWADQEKRIHECLVESLQRLIASNTIKPTDNETTITGQLRPIVKSIWKSKNIRWAPQFESASFTKATDARPSGHPDIRFVGRDNNRECYEYDIECKLVRVKRTGKTQDYCRHYITQGVMRYCQSGKYAQSSPPMGTMLGYLQEGDFNSLLHTINENAKQEALNELRVNGKQVVGGVTKLSHKLKRQQDEFTLHHLWADLR